MTAAQPKVGTVWVEEVIRADCRNCGKPLRMHPIVPGISGGNPWYHPHNSYQRHNGHECDPEEAKT